MNFFLTCNAPDFWLHSSHLSMHNSGSAIRSTRSSRSTFSPPHCNFYAESKSVKVGHDLWHDLSLSCTHLETKQHIAIKVEHRMYQWWSSVSQNVVQCCPPLWGAEFQSQPCLKEIASTTQTRNLWFGWYFIQCLNNWHSMYYKSSRSRVKGQGHSMT